MSFRTLSSFKPPRAMVLAALALVGVVLSLAAYGILAAQQRVLIRTQLEADAEQRGRAIERRLRSDVASVFQLSPFLGERGPGTRDDFRRLAEGILGTNQDLGALMWIPRVPLLQRTDHEATARAQGFTGYHIRRWSPEGESRDGEQAHRAVDALPIYFAEPQDRHAGKRGVDLATAPVLARELAQAVEPGRPGQMGRLVVTRPISWGDDHRDYAAILVFRPMYDNASPSDSDAERREKFVGYLAAAIRVDALLEGALYIFAPEIHVAMFDDAAANGREFLCGFDADAARAFFLPPSPDATPESNGAVLRMAMEVPGRSWSLEFRPASSYLARHRGPLPMVVLAFGLLLTGLVTTYANTLMSRAAGVERIVEQRTAELAHERFLLDTLLNHSPDYIYFKDAQSRFIRISRALAGYFGLNEPAEAVGKTDFDFFDAERARQYRADEQEVMRTGLPAINKEEEQPWPDGRVTWLSTTKVPLFDAQGQVIGTFGISRDVTAQKRAAEEVRQARDAAEAASRAKSDFLANMSHEIRTPMNAIIGMTELVLGTELSASQRDYLTMVQASADSLLAILNDVLDFSKIEAGKLELHPALFDLEDELSKATKSLALKAHAKGLELACRVRPGTPSRFVGDATRLRQILVNLLSNAIKFTEQGEVLVEVGSSPAVGNGEDADEAMLHISVTDTGIGIPPDKLEKIFDAFEQVDTSTTRRFGGAGLGLAICTRLVELMGGKIWAESEVGRGSTFHVTARLRLARNGAAEPAALPPAVRDARILVVDDNATNRRILEEMLANWGMSAHSVPHGSAAIDALREAQRSGRPFQLVLTDANMPELDGFQLAQQVKSDAQLGSTVIMMLTSGDRPGDVARCEQIGVAAYLLKPIHQSELLESILMALGASATQQQPSPALAGDAAPLGPLRILLAEDSLVNQKLAVGLLSRHGHSVIVANDGQEAVAALATHDVDLVLMDVQMPGMDGFEATAAIRAKEKRSGKHVPILAMTAHAMKGDRERCLEAGMDDYIAKPISANQLFAKMRELLGRPAAAR